MNPTFSFTAELGVWEGKGAAWVLAHLPLDDSDEIREIVPNPRGFGSIRVRVAIDEIEWLTSIFPDSKSGRYIVFIKAPIRKKANVDIGDTVDFRITLLLD